MTTSAAPETLVGVAGLFDDLPMPSEVQVTQAQAMASAKRSLGAPRLREANPVGKSNCARAISTRCWLRTTARAWRGLMLCGRT